MLTLTTRDVASAERAEYWKSVLSEHYFAVDGGSPEPDAVGFSGRMDRVSFGGLRLDRTTAHPYRVVRSAKHARQSPSGSLLMFTLRRGRVVVEQERRTALLTQPGDFALIDSDQAYGAELVVSSELTIIQIPHAWTAPHFGGLLQRTAIRLTGRSGLAAPAVSTLLALLNHISDREDAVARVAAKSAVDFAVAAVFEQLDGPQRSGGSRAAILARAQRLMLDQIGYSELAPAQIAAAIPISERYLFSVFRDVGTTPAEWLRAARLDRASALLSTSHAANDAPSIQEVACAVGIPHASHFSRLFRERFGVSPSAYRSAGADRAAASV